METKNVTKTIMVADVQTAVTILVNSQSKAEDVIQAIEYLRVGYTRALDPKVYRAIVKAQGARVDLLPHFRELFKSRLCFLAEAEKLIKPKTLETELGTSNNTLETLSHTIGTSNRSSSSTCYIFTEDGKLAWTANGPMLTIVEIPQNDRVKFEKFRGKTMSKVGELKDWGYKGNEYQKLLGSVKSEHLLLSIPEIEYAIKNTSYIDKQGGQHERTYLKIDIHDGEGGNEAASDKEWIYLKMEYAKKLLKVTKSIYKKANSIPFVLVNDKNGRNTLILAQLPSNRGYSMAIVSSLKESENKHFEGLNHPAYIKATKASPQASKMWPFVDDAQDATKGIEQAKEEAEQAQTGGIETPQKDATKEDKPQTSTPKTQGRKEGAKAPKKDDTKDATKVESGAIDSLKNENEALRKELEALKDQANAPKSYAFDLNSIEIPTASETPIHLDETKYMGILNYSIQGQRQTTQIPPLVANDLQALLSTLETNAQRIQQEGGVGILVSIYKRKIHTKDRYKYTLVEMYTNKAEGLSNDEGAVSFARGIYNPKETIFTTKATAEAWLSSQDAKEDIKEAQ